MELAVLALVVIALVVGGLYVRFQLRGEVVGHVNTLYGVRVVVARHASGDGVAPVVDLKLRGPGFGDVVALDGHEAEQFAYLLEQAAQRARA